MKPTLPTAPTGIAPTPAQTAAIGETRLCGACATLIRYHPTESAWRHCIIGLDHAPEPFGAAFDAWRSRIRDDDGAVLDERDPEIVTESELRLLDGNR